MDASAGVPFSLSNQVSLRSNEDKNYSVALSSQRNGQGLERPRVGGHRYPIPRVPHAPMAGLWGSWKPTGPPGPARRLLASGWRCSGAWQRWQARVRVASLVAQLQRAPPPPTPTRREVQLAGPTGRSGRSELKGGAAQGS